MTDHISDEATFAHHSCSDNSYLFNDNIFGGKTVFKQFFLFKKNVTKKFHSKNRHSLFSKSKIILFLQKKMINKQIFLGP